MIADVPVVNYRKTDEKGNVIHTKEECDTLVARWEALRGKKAGAVKDKKKISLNELLK